MHGQLLHHVHQTREETERHSVFSSSSKGEPLPVSAQRIFRLLDFVRDDDASRETREATLPSMSPVSSPSQSVTTVGAGTGVSPNLSTSFYSLLPSTMI